MKRQFFAGKRPLQPRHELATKHAAEHAHRQEEVRLTRNPARAIRRDAAGWNHAVHVRVMQQILAPGVQHRQKTNLRSQMPRIGRDLQQCSRSGLQQQTVN